MLSFVVQKILGGKEKKKYQIIHQLKSTIKSLRGKKENFGEGEKLRGDLHAFTSKKQHKCIYLENECMTFTSGLGFSIVTKS